MNQPVTFAPDAGDPVLLPSGSSVFGEAETNLLDRTELALFLSSPDGVSQGGSAWIQDDPAAGDAVWPGFFSSGSFGLNVIDAKRANLDDDSEDEMVLLSASADTLRVYSVDVDPATQTGSFQLLHELGPAATNDTLVGSLVVADFDGDKRDEIAVFRTLGPPLGMDQSSDFWVFDDPTENGVQLLRVSIASPDLFGDHRSLSGLAADLDADGRSELVVVRDGNDFFDRDFVGLSVFTWSDSTDQLQRRTFPQLVYLAPFTILRPFLHTKACAGQFDSDPEDEIVLMSADPASIGYLAFNFTQLSFDPGTAQFHQVATSRFSGACEATPVPFHAFDVCAVDRFGDGRDWIASVRKPLGGNASVRCIRFDEGTGSWSSDLISDATPLARDAVCLETGDSDANGAEELYVGYSWGAGTSKSSYVEVLGAGVTPTRRVTGLGGSVTAPTDEYTRPLVLVPGEFDGDGLRVRFDRASIKISNPVPLVVIAAVPSKAGIEQNYIGCSSTYASGAGTGMETAYSTGTTITAKAGVDFEDFTGTFGASVKATMEREARTTQSLSSEQRFVTGFTNGSDDDAIVFASNLYLVHEYTIMDAPDPNVIGTQFTIDAPQDVRISKWAVSFYNANVAPEYRIGSDVLPHTVGRPETYRNAAEVANLTSSFVSWRTPTVITAPLGTGGQICTSISLVSELATTEQTTMALGAESSYKAWGATVEGSISASSSSAYTVSTNLTTDYTGCVGDISAADYVAWAYDTGMYVYQAGRLANGSNQPTGSWLPGAFPLTVVNFWTEAWGSGY
ncbi:hypothetical protein Poly30_56240 [Planctomycetes bacterium Poly30]|uniref:FG-GAP repeat protein n=1 Tax=Saltatorellus ferox TaxID=2528018 RepID=A0A518F138_9BACT|nr:hypothetical protein Poly30_56240 [Planctomycetes bacterium Poly30]